MTHRDGYPRLSARSAWRGDAGHRKPCGTPSESLGKPPFRSRGRTAGGRRKASTMSRIARSFPATRPLARRIARAISMGHYQRSLVLGSARASACGRPAAPFTAPGAPPAREVSPGPAASVSRATRRERNGLRRYGLTIRVLPLESRTRGWEYPRNRAARQDAGKRTVWMILRATSV